MGTGAHSLKTVSVAFGNQAARLKQPFAATRGQDLSPGGPQRVFRHLGNFSCSLAHLRPIPGLHGKGDRGSGAACAQ